MYKIKVKEEYGELKKDYTGCVEMRISDSGCISATFYTGETRVYKMCEGEEVIQHPMTDAEILATEGLGDWYLEQKAEHEAQQAAAEKVPTTAPVH